ncbi:MAG: GNAT family N-acetyltransferase [Geminicoccaceae bacterium]
MLRAHEVRDFEPSAAMWADPAVVRYISGVPSTPEASWSRLLRYVGHWRLLGYGYWAVTLKTDGLFIGEVGFADYKRDLTPSQTGLPEAGWVLSPTHQAQGLAGEAVARVLAWADVNLDAPSTFCILDPAHTASLKIARKNGYGRDTQASYQGNPVLLLSRERPRRPGKI